MKRIIALLVVTVTLASCAERNPLYFDETKSRIYYDANGEFDTLSYAVGMNLGLGMSLRQSDIFFDFDVVSKIMNDEFRKGEFDYRFYEENSRELTRFQALNLRPYNMAKQNKTFTKDTTALPELYNEEYTPERVCEMYSYDYVNYIERLDVPANVYWIVKAIKDSKVVANESEIDSLMDINTEAVRRMVSGYMKNEFPAHNEECSRRWLANVAKQKDIQMLVVEGDTLYYRINNPGNEVKPTGIHDTVSFNYTVYTRKGRIVESLDQRIEHLTQRLNEIRAEDKSPADTASQNFLMKRVEEQLDMAKNLRIPLKQASIKGARYALQHIGEGGSITMWMPASLAYGSRGNRAIAPNDGVVMEVTLKSVTIAEQEEPEIFGPGMAKVKPLPAHSKKNIIVPSPGTITPTEK